MKKKIANRRNIESEEGFREEPNDRRSQPIHIDDQLSNEFEENFFVKEAESPETDEVDSKAREKKWIIQRQVSVRDKSIPQQVFNGMKNILNE